MILMVHMPKCGGQSFLESLRQEYGEGLHLHYNTPMSADPAARIKHRLIKAAGPFYRFKIPDTAQIVYGHYSFNDFRNKLADKAVKKAMFFREPIEWLGSYIYYTKQKHPARLSGDIVKDIQKYRLHKSYQLFLGDCKVDELDFVGVTEHYQDSINLFNDIFGTRLEAVYKNKTQNAPRNYRESFKSEGLLKELEEIMQGNIKIYEQALSRYKALNKQKTDVDSVKRA